jgi:hypothetical protein
MHRASADDITAKDRTDKSWAQECLLQRLSGAILELALGNRVFRGGFHNIANLYLHSVGHFRGS